MLRLNLGCGRKKLDGYINIDKNEHLQPDIVRNIEKGLPFTDNSVDEVYISHTLEHIKDLIFVMDEIWRVCKPDVLVKIIVPYGLSVSGVRDPTHIRFFVEDSFDYFDRDTVLGQIGYGKCNFKVLKRKRDGEELYFELKTVKQKLISERKSNILMTPKLSIIIPHLNYGRFLPQLLDSIFNQTFKDFEVILVDGGSTDNTFEVLKNYPDVKVIHDITKQHIPHAVNMGILESQGEYLNIACSDCYFEPIFLEECVKVLDNSDSLGFVYTTGYFIDENDKKFGLMHASKHKHFDRDKLLSHGNYIDLMSGVFKRECLSKVGYFDESLPYHFDWLMWIRISRYYGVYFINKPLMNFRLHKTQRLKDREFLLDYLSAKIKIEREEGKFKSRLIPSLFMMKKLLSYFYGWRI